MKLKTLLWMSLFSLFLYSCIETNEIELSATKTDLELTMTLEVVNNDSIPLKTSLQNDQYSFSGSGTICLKEYTEFNNYITDIQKVTPRTGSNLHIAGIESGNQINSLQISWSTIKENEIKFSDPVDLTPLLSTITNGEMKIIMTTETDPFVDCIECEPGCMFKVEISGTSNFEISSVAKLKIPVTVERKIYNSHFSIF